jgi:hypothetical protein
MSNFQGLIFGTAHFRIAHLAKTLSVLLPAFRAAAPPSKSSKTLLALFRDAVIAHCSLGPAPGGLRGAVFHKARSLRLRSEFSSPEFLDWLSHARKFA